MRLFISYNSRDFALALALAQALRRRLGPDAEIFVAPQGLRGGTIWQEKLAEQLARADTFLLLITESGIGPWQLIEYYEAHDHWVRDRSRMIVPVLKENQSAPGLPFLHQFHWIVEADPASEKSVGRILDAIASPGPGRLREPWRYTRPYRGLVAMTEADTDFFFGREAETERVLKTFSNAPERLPILLGNSGAGKTSIAQAGVLAALKKQAWPRQEAAPAWPRPFRASRRWAMLTIRPGKAPLQSLLEAFWPLWRYEALDPDREALQEKWVRRLQDGSASLKGLLDATEDRLTELGEDPPPAFLLYVDQGEELYTRADPEQARRFSIVLAAGLEDERLRAFASLRSDFYGRLQEDEPLYRRWERVDIHPLDRAALLAVIRRPAERLEAAFLDPELPGELARQTLAHTGYLPLLSYLLDDMWGEMQRRGDGRLVPGVGAINVGSVLAASGDRFLDEHPGERAALRRLITLKLVHLEEQGPPLRRRATRAEFSDEEWRLVTTLAGYPWRLLVTGREEGSEPFAEVGHEALLREWGQLREWLTGERELLTWKTALERMRLRYDRLGGEEKKGALLKGYDLQQARAWRDLRGEDLPAADRAYIKASLAAEDEAVEAGRRQLAQARTAQSSFLGDLARQKLAEGRIGKALALALEAVPTHVPDWPTVAVAENALFAAVHAHSSALVRPLVTFVGHEGTVRGALFTADGGRVLTWSHDGTARLWEAATGGVLAVLRHEGEVLGAALSGDGGRVLTWSRDGKARSWRMAGGAPPVVFPHEHLVKGARFSADESRVLTWSHDGTARLWEARGGEPIAVLAHGGRVAGAVFSADQARILTWSGDGTARLWDAVYGASRAVLRHDGPVRGALFSADERRILTWSADGTAGLWESESGELRTLQRHGDGGPDDDHGILGGAFAHGESRILTWGSDGTARLWDATGDAPTLVLAHDGGVLGAVFSSDEAHLLTWAVDGMAHLWDAATGEKLAGQAHEEAVLGASFSPDGKTILSWSSDGAARLWPGSGKEGRKLALRHGATVRAAAFSTQGGSVWTRSDDGAVRLWSREGHELATLHHEGEVLGWSVSFLRMLTWSSDGTARLWDLDPRRFTLLEHDGAVRGGALTRDGGRVLTWSAGPAARLRDRAEGGRDFRLQHEGAMLGAVFSPCERRVLTWSEDGRVRLWDAGSGEQLAEIRGAGGQVLGAAWMADTSQVLTWARDGTVGLWNLDGTARIWFEHPGGLTGAAPSPDGRQVLTWSQDGTARLWDARGGRQLSEWRHGAPVLGGRCSASGERALTWSASDRIHLWDAVNGAELGSMQHAGRVVDAILSRDGSRLLSSSWDGTARLWETSTGEARSLLLHRGKVSGAALSADETQVLTWSDDGTARVWDAETGQVRVALRHELAVSKASFSPGEKWVLTCSHEAARLWDRATGEELASLDLGGQGGNALLAADGSCVLTWPQQGTSARLWPIWSSLASLAEHASAVVETLRPLSRIDRCRAHLDTAGCEELGGTSERDLAISGDARLSLYRLQGVGNLTDFAVGVAADSVLHIEVAVMSSGTIVVFHSHPLEGLEAFTFHRLTRSLDFVRKDGDVRNFGLPVLKLVAEGLERADRVLLILMKPESLKPLAFHYLPLDVL